MKRSTRSGRDRATAVAVPETVASPQLKRIGGSDRDAFNSHLANQALRSMWLAHARDGQDRDDAYQAALAALMGIAPKDEIEGMIAAQMVAAHASVMECFRRSMLEKQTFDGRNQNLAFANKAARSFAHLLDALGRYRGAGIQKMVVEHVNVFKGGQAIVGDVRGGGGGSQSS